MCETPKSPPGDYKSNSVMYSSRVKVRACETPKSPPGDYNIEIALIDVIPVHSMSVKHLNPRQGITTYTIPIVTDKRAP